MSKIIGFRRDFVCRPRPRSQLEVLLCQPASASSARHNYDQIILVETSEKGWRVTQGWHPEEGIRGTAENHKRFGIPEKPASRLLNSLIYRYFSDINELNLPKTCGTEFPDPDDLLSFKLIICPDEVSKPERLSQCRRSIQPRCDFFFFGCLSKIQTTFASLTIDNGRQHMFFNGPFITVSGILQRR